MLGNDYSEGYDFGSAKREAIGSSDSSSYTSDRSTTNGRDNKLNTPNTKSTSVASLDDG